MRAWRVLLLGLAAAAVVAAQRGWAADGLARLTGSRLVRVRGD